MLEKILGAIVLVTFVALALVVYGQEWAAGLAGVGIVVLVAYAVYSSGSGSSRRRRR